MLNSKKLFLIFFLVLFSVLILSNFSFAQKPLEVDYPKVFGEKLPENPLLPEYIKYIFNLALLIGGLIAFGALVSGGFRYMSSVGSPATMDDAKNQITAGILGLIILLSSYLVLTTVNPQLVILKIKKTPVKQGIIIFSDINCPGNNSPQGEEGKDWKIIAKDTADLTKELQDEFGVSLPVKSVYFFHPGEDLKIEFFPQTDFKPSPNYTFKNQTPGSCELINGVKSVQLSWVVSGVYLCDDISWEGEEKIYTQPSPNLGDFEDKASSIKFVNPPTSTETAYGAILHSDRDYKGGCVVYLKSHSDLDNSPSPHSIGYPIGENTVSSLTIFKKPGLTDIVKCKIWLCDDVDCCDPSIGRCDGGYMASHCDCKLLPYTGNFPAKKFPSSFKNKAKSIYIYNEPDSDGKCLVDLTDDSDLSGKCEIFSGQDSDLSNNIIGNCFSTAWWDPFGWVTGTTGPCAENAIIIPVKK